MNQLDNKDTGRTLVRYQRISYFYDFFEFFPELVFRNWRKRMWELVEGNTILEIGVGTGKNLPYYPSKFDISALDLTPGMLRFAKKRAERLDVQVDLHLGDVQKLQFQDNSFDSVAATFVFCSVPDPVLGFREVKRVLKSGGKIYLLEHVQSVIPIMRGFKDFINPLVVRAIGANVNRDTVENVKKAGFEIVQVHDIGAGDTFKMIVARPL